MLVLSPQWHGLSTHFGARAWATAKPSGRPAFGVPERAQEGTAVTRATETEKSQSWRTLPRNVWAVSLTSFFMDMSSEMVIDILPLFPSNVLGVALA